MAPRVPSKYHLGLRAAAMSECMNSASRPPSNRIWMGTLDLMIEQATSLVEMNFSS